MTGLYTGFFKFAEKFYTFLKSLIKIDLMRLNGLEKEKTKKRWAKISSKIEECILL